MDPKKIEKTLKELEEIRSKNHMSYETMGREIGVSARTISRWLKRDYLPSPLALGLIYNFIGKWGKK